MIAATAAAATTTTTTTLPTNLRPTTSEYVHLVMHGQFCHVTKMAVKPLEPS